MIGLDEANMGAIVHTYDLKDYYYPTLFPLKQTNTLTWKMLEGQAGLKIAADITARGATIPQKVREAIAKIQGDIPKIAIRREKDEDELTQYDIMVAMASNNPAVKELVEFWAEDTKFCWQGVAARIEWMALRQISLGVVRVTNQNNSSVVSEFDLDYQIPSTQKLGVSVRYDNSTDAKPLSVDIPAALKVGKDIGVSYKFMMMNKATFLKFASQKEVVTECSSLIQNLTKSSTRPNLTTVNEYLSANSELYNGLQIVQIDQDITIELADGSRTTANPFEDDVILFSESKTLGATYWKTPIDAKKIAGSVAEKVMHGHTLIKKYSTESPVTEVTEGIANAFPAWNLAGRSVLMQVNATSWDKN